MPNLSRFLVNRPRSLSLKGDYAQEHVNTNLTVKSDGKLSSSSVFAFAG